MLAKLPVVQSASPAKVNFFFFFFFAQGIVQAEKKHGRKITAVHEWMWTDKKTELIQNCAATLRNKHISKDKKSNIKDIIKINFCMIPFVIQ